MSPSGDLDTPAAQVPAATSPARERSDDSQEDKSSPTTVALLDAIKQLTSRIDVIERAVTPRQTAVSPDQQLRRSSGFRQAIEHGSLGLQRMQLDELGDGDQQGVQTPERKGHASFYGGAPQPLYRDRIRIARNALDRVKRQMTKTLMEADECIVLHGGRLQGLRQSAHRVASRCRRLANCVKFSDKDVIIEFDREHDLFGRSQWLAPPSTSTREHPRLSSLPSDIRFRASVGA